MLLFGSVALGCYIRFPYGEISLSFKQFIVYSISFICVFQLSLYYFQLYDLKIVQNNFKYYFRLLQSVIGATVLLVILYYLYSFATFGIIKIFISLSFGTIAVLLLRMSYIIVSRRKNINERIIILGTGEFAKEIAHQIQIKQNSGFELLGLIEENNGNIGKRKELNFELFNYTEKNNRQTLKKEDWEIQSFNYRKEDKRSIEYE